MKIIMTWNAEDGTEADQVLKALVGNRQEKFVTTIERGGVIHLVGSDTWLSTNKAHAAVDQILAEARGNYSNDLNLHGAFYNNETIWPDGFDPKAAGAINVDEDLKKARKGN